MENKRSKVVDQYVDIGYLLEYLQTGTTTEVSLEKLGRNKKWFYDVKRRYPKLSEAVKQAEKEWERHIQSLAEFAEAECNVEFIEAPEIRPNLFEQITLTALVMVCLLDIIMIAYAIYLWCTM